MSQALRSAALNRLCDALDSVAPTAPTLCEGWDAHDLAVHIWVLKHDPLSWPGLAVPSLAEYSHRRGARVRHRREYPELVQELRHGPAGFACIPGDALEGHRHAIGEYLIHANDVAAPNGVHLPPLDEAMQDALWKRLQPAALALHAFRAPGLRARRPDGRQQMLTPGRPRTRISGTPEQLILWVYGRPADVLLEQR